MSGRVRSAATLAALTSIALLLVGCPIGWEKEERPNSPPFTFFNLAPEDTTFQNEVSFRWLGTDLDSDVVFYQYQLVETDSLYYFTGGLEGRVLRSLDPRREFAPGDPDTLWSDRSLNNFQVFSELDDGWYEMRARSIDAAGLASDVPARKRFYVFFDDVLPNPIIVDPRPGGTTPACGRIPVTSWSFFLDATDESRNATTPRERLEYSYQLRARSLANCTTHLTDSYTEWRYFPPGTGFVEVGNAPPTFYTDLFDANCGWELTFRVRDPAGNVASTLCCITRGTGCQ